MKALARADQAAGARLEAAFAREERRGLMMAAATRSVAVAIIIGWLAVSNPERGLALAWVLGSAAFFLVTGLAQFWLWARGVAPSVAPYAFMLVDSLALAAVLLMPNPFDTLGVPWALPLRYASFVYFFLLLMQAAFSFRPRLLLWTGLCGAGAWTLAFVWIVTRPETISAPPSAADRAAMLATYFDPHFASILKYENEVIAFLLVSAGLALLVRRSRVLVAERAEAERERSNLARYFSPKVVDVLAERDQPLGRVRRQAVGVLFADLVGFTTLAESMSPEQVMAMLRGFHGRMEDEVFRHGGCLEKFIGDALLATFGVPDPGPRDATDTLACARGMLAALTAWNREREKEDQPPLRMGVGLHYGQAVLGDIGSARSMAFATVGDTINVASRLQGLTRDLGATIVASADFVAALDQEGADPALAAGLAAQGPRILRGRDHAIEVWAGA
ncbi:MAG: adenylate/guanylate cyclase domain-containing protein [Candidatus Rokuibacteriota bacterium]|nr:MAG: adenylate/guanylate cyclase domain-containing protein [Candidatus Rokubacteria bacterium]